MNNYYKYLKYKNKYLNLKNNSRYKISGGAGPTGVVDSADEEDHKTSIIRLSKDGDRINVALCRFDKSKKENKKRIYYSVYHLTTPDSILYSQDTAQHVINDIKDICFWSNYDLTNKIKQISTISNITEITTLTSWYNMKNLGIIIIYSLDEITNLKYSTGGLDTLNSTETITKDYTNSILQHLLNDIIKQQAFGVYNGEIHHQVDYKVHSRHWLRYFYSHSNSISYNTGTTGTTGTAVPDGNHHVIISCMPSSDVSKSYCDYNTFQYMYSPTSPASPTPEKDKRCVKTYIALCLFYSFMSSFINGIQAQKTIYIISLKYIKSTLINEAAEELTFNFICTIINYVLTYIFGSDYYLQIRIYILDTIDNPKTDIQSQILTQADDINQTIDTIKQ